MEQHSNTIITLRFPRSLEHPISIQPCNTSPSLPDTIITLGFPRRMKHPISLQTSNSILARSAESCIAALWTRSVCFRHEAKENVIFWFLLTQREWRPLTQFFGRGEWIKLTRPSSQEQGDSLVFYSRHAISLHSSHRKGDQFIPSRLLNAQKCGLLSRSKQG